MSKFNTIVAAALLVTAGFSTAASQAATNDGSQRVVKFEDLNLSTPSDAASLYTRLQSASREVCSGFNGRELERVRQFNACYEKALGNAIKDVNSMTQTNLSARAE